MLKSFGISLLLAIAVPAAARTIAVSTSDELRSAARTARPGDVIRLAPGTYAGVFLTNLHGSSDGPITIEGADEHDPPLFKGGAEAIHIAGCSHVVLRHLACAGQSANGISIDDAG